MRRSWIAFAFASAAAIVIAACSLGFGDDFTGGAPDVDAATDATSDVLLPTSDADASSCDASLCDDFDDGPLGAAWTRVRQANGGVGMLDDGGFTSPPRSLLVQLPEGGTAAKPVEFLLVDELATNASVVSCAVDVYVEDGPTDFTWFDVIHVGAGGQLDSGVVQSTLLVAVHGNDVSIRDDVLYSDGGSSLPRTWPKTGASIARNTWVRLEVITDFSNVRLRIDGIDRLATTLLAYPRNGFGIAIGGTSYDPPSWRIRLDRARCTFEP